MIRNMFKVHNQMERHGFLRESDLRLVMKMLDKDEDGTLTDVELDKLLKNALGVDVKLSQVCQVPKQVSIAQLGTILEELCRKYPTANVADLIMDWARKECKQYIEKMKSQMQGASEDKPMTTHMSIEQSMEMFSKGKANGKKKGVACGHQLPRFCQ